jgi:hypothetical protein
MRFPGIIAIFCIPCSFAWGFSCGSSSGHVTYTPIGHAFSESLSLRLAQRVHGKMRAPPVTQAEMSSEIDLMWAAALAGAYAP